ncbi:MAG: hypothetical protein GVY07_00755 [Bacteroidetes bacterium]|jgi:hypothetical protein|nr:hypothetical protein [Bacteroidota bacterium]
MKKQKKFTTTDIKSRTWIILIFLSLPLLILSCSSGGSTDPLGDNNDTNDNNNNDTNEIGLEPTFSNVQMIFSQNCGSCHIGRSDSGVRLNNYQNVVNSVGDQYAIEVIQPGNADESPLIDKIEPDPEIGSRMPQGGPFLSSDRIDQIREWIDEGAENN